MCLPFASLLMARTSANTRSPPSSKALTLSLLRAYLSARSSLFFFLFSGPQSYICYYVPSQNWVEFGSSPWRGCRRERAASAKWCSRVPYLFNLHRKAFTACVAALLFTVQHNCKDTDLKTGLDGLLLLFFISGSHYLKQSPEHKFRVCGGCLCFKTKTRKKKCLNDHTRRASYPAWFLRVSFDVDFWIKDDVMDWIYENCNPGTEIYFSKTHPAWWKVMLCQQKAIVHPAWWDLDMQHIVPHWC